MGRKVPVSCEVLANHWGNLSNYFKYSGLVRRLIYTINPIERLHRQIRKFTKIKDSFTGTNALYKQVYYAIKKAEQD